ncbi:MAG: 50S ribosomal protein L4 [Alphaproteobacteria bacterium]|nr:50S ribosomal protein L4 [Alphaproteobacteria bacterium]
MQVDVIDWNNAKVGKADLPDAVFAAEVKADVIARVIHWQLAKRRSGTHLVKTRSTVSGTTRKPWAQKKLGRARAGSLRGAQFRGGGIVFGPVVRSYAYALNKKIRVLGLRCALSLKAKNGKLVVVSDLNVKKTKDLNQKVAKMGITSALVIGGAKVDEDFARAARNLPNFDVLPTIGANVYDIIRRDTLVLTKEAIETLTARAV